MKAIKKIKLNKAKSRQIGKKYQLCYLVLFGSRAEACNRKQSDYDIAYSSARNLSYGDEVFLAEDLAKAFKVEPGKIDLVNTKKSGPLLAKEIATNGQVLAEYLPDSFDMFQIYALTSYYEAQPLFKLQAEFVKKNLA